MKVTQEHDHVSGRAILIALAVVVSVSAIGVLTAYLLAAWRGEDLTRGRGDADGFGPVPGSMTTAVPGQVPEEVNQIEQVLFDDRAPGLEERAMQHTLLRSFGWVDREAGLVRIPIDHAIELYVLGQRARDLDLDPQGPPEEQP